MVSNTMSINNRYLNSRLKLHYRLSKFWYEDMYICFEQITNDIFWRKLKEFPDFIANFLEEQIYF